MTLKLSPDVVFRDMDGEAVILDLHSGAYFGLNEVGTRIWQLIAGGSDEQAIVTTVASEYAAEPATIARDVEHLLTELRTRGLILAEGADEPA